MIETFIFVGAKDLTNTSQGAYSWKVANICRTCDSFATFHE